MYETEKSYISFLCDPVGDRLHGKETESHEIIRL